MSKIQIFADSTCDLTKELLKKYKIKIIPLSIILDDKSYYDGLEITPDDIFKWADAKKSTPKTSATSYEQIYDAIKPHMQAGDDIIFFGISGDMSSTCNVARFVAQENYNRLFVIDSRNLSTGIGLQVIKAAEMAEAGKSAEEIVDYINKRKGAVRASFVIDTLTYLARGGRCTPVTALMANTLKLHPMIVVKDGKMGVSKKFLGKMDFALSKYVSELTKDLLAADKSRVFITHSGCSEATIEKVRVMLEELGCFDEILITRAGGVISSHCGPNTLGVLYYVNSDAE
jgi:DegV family protein with EDD domain